MAGKGIKEVLDSFDRLEKAAQNRVVRSAINAALNPVLKEARASAPKGKAPHKTYKGRTVPPGFLSNSIIKQTRISKDKRFVFGTVRPKSEAWYGSLLEHGWRAGGRSKRVKRESKRQKGGLSQKRLAELGDTRTRVPGNKWWSNAVSRASGQVDAAFQKKMDQAIMRAFKRR
jgi:HK97 gp10 family phage protein